MTESSVQLTPERLAELERLADVAAAWRHVWAVEAKSHATARQGQLAAKEVVLAVPALLEQVQRLSEERDALIDRLGRVRMTAAADRERANEAARLSAAARDATDDLNGQIDKMREHVEIVEESRGELIVVEERLGRERDQARAEVEQLRQKINDMLAIRDDVVEQTGAAVRRMRPVFDAARAWREATKPHMPTKVGYEAEAQLILAVDAAAEPGGLAPVESPAEPEHAFDEGSVLNPATGKPYGPGPLWAGSEPMDYPDPMCVCGSLWDSERDRCQDDGLHGRDGDELAELASMAQLDATETSDV